MTQVRVRRAGLGNDAGENDCLAVEEPLEIQVVFHADNARQTRSVAVTMRTPGQDEALAAGFLFTEGVLHEAGQIALTLRQPSVVRFELEPSVQIDWPRLQRHSYATSSCGVCGKMSLGALHTHPRWPLPARTPVVAPQVIHQLPGQMRSAQAAFALTGGLHASALFTAEGELLSVFEDVGRHNALDKLIGAEFLAGRLPLSDRILAVSGRVSFELVQKALMAGVPMIAAVGAPSSLAVEMAEEAGMTLLGFVRDNRFNAYSAPWRTAVPA